MPISLQVVRAGYELYDVILSAEIFPGLKCLQWINISNDLVRDAKF